MADLQLKDQPVGWTEHRKSLRLHDGEVWHQIEMEFDQREYDAVRLRTLEELEIDFMTRDELYDYLSWMAEELDIDISDMYRMYLGYSVGAMED